VGYSSPRQSQPHERPVSWRVVGYSEVGLTAEDSASQSTDCSSSSNNVKARSFREADLSRPITEKLLTLQRGAHQPHLRLSA
jgi:hypothetical protein